MIFYSRYCIMGSGVVILARKMRLVMTMVVESWITHKSLDPMVWPSNFHCLDYMFLVWKTFFILKCACLGSSLKGYLCYKTIASQNVPPKAQIKHLFISYKNYVPSQDIQVFVFLTIPWFTKSVTSRWVLVHETRWIFEYIFWTTNHEVTKLGALINISKDNNFQ